jgi:hypothetical protein
VAHGAFTKVLLAVDTIYLFINRAQVVVLAARHAIPAVYWQRAFPDAGGLIANRALQIATGRSDSMRDRSSRARIRPTCQVMQATKVRIRDFPAGRYPEREPAARKPMGGGRQRLKRLQLLAGRLLLALRRVRREGAHGRSQASGGARARPRASQAQGRRAWLSPAKMSR